MNTEEVTQRLTSARDAIDAALAALGQPRAPAANPAAGSADLLHGYEAIGNFLGIGARQVEHWATTTDVPTFKIGRAVCARRGDLNEWLSRQGAR